MNKDNNNDDLLSNATTTFEKDNANNNNSTVVQQLNYLQNLLKTSINSKEFEEQGGNYIEYLVSTVKKTVRQEDSLIRQILYTALSAYSQDPINLGIMAPTSEGKSYAAIETLNIFPKRMFGKLVL